MGRGKVARKENSGWGYQIRKKNNSLLLIRHNKTYITKPNCQCPGREGGTRVGRRVGKEALLRILFPRKRKGGRLERTKKKKPINKERKGFNDLIEKGNITSHGWENSNMRKSNSQGLKEKGGPNTTGGFSFLKKRFVTAPYAPGGGQGSPKRRKKPLPRSWRDETG